MTIWKANQMLNTVKITFIDNNKQNEFLQKSYLMAHIDHS